MKAHPYANAFPMLEGDAHDELRESIRANGLRNPVVVTPDGLILDGRNRYDCCLELGIETETVMYEGTDLAEYVIDCNVTRRNQSTGSRAMSTALVLAQDGRRANGRWEYGAVNSNDLGNSLAEYVRRAGVVLDFQPELAPAVVRGELALDAAFKRADEVRRSEKADEVLERERKKREREEVKAEAERNAQIVADLTKAGATKYLDLYESGQFSPAEAWAAYQEATRKEREKAAAIERGIRDSVTHIGNAVHFLIGGSAAADIYVEHVAPHHDRYAAEARYLTPEHIDAAIDYLTTLRKAL